MDILEQLDGSQELNAETQPVETPTETPPEQVAEQPAETPTEATTEKPAQPRGPDGKFAKKDEPIMVPLQALHETRDKVKTLEAQLAAMTQPQQAAPQTPDIFADPDGYAAHIQNQIAATALNDRLNLSEEMVRQSAGDETVNAAQEWGRQMMSSNPMFAQAFYAQRNPYGFLVNEYKRHNLVAQLGDDPTQIEAFLAWRNSQGQAQPNPTPAVPASLADQQSARGAAVPHQPPSLEEILHGKT